MARKEPLLPLTETGFNRLLQCLDADREAAGQKYEVIRRKLLRFFEWRNCPASEELADRTIDRVIRRLNEGEEIRASDQSVYFYAVARYIEHEWRKAQTESAQRFERFALHRPQVTSDADEEQRFYCLDRCLQNLAPAARQLIVEYYQAEGHQKIENRRRMASLLQVSQTALRLRAHKIREQLEKCVRQCLAQTSRNPLDLTESKEV